MISVALTLQVMKQKCWWCQWSSKPTWWAWWCVGTDKLYTKKCGWSINVCWIKKEKDSCFMALLCYSCLMMCQRTKPEQPRGRDAGVGFNVAFHPLLQLHPQPVSTPNRRLGSLRKWPHQHCFLFPSLLPAFSTCSVPPIVWNMAWWSPGIHTGNAPAHPPSKIPQSKLLKRQRIMA